MADVPEAYYQFVMDYAPYAYVIPPNTPDSEIGRTAFAAAFAIDFLYEAYFNMQFEDRRTEISNKIVSLANWILTQQCTDNGKLAYGGFKNNENSTHYYSVDACRVIPSLLKAYELTSNVDYLNSAKLAAATFLYNMQHKPSQLGVHDKYYGGLARAVTITDTWLQQMDIECLYGLAGLRLLCEYDQENKAKYEVMMSDAIAFLREGFENLWLYFDPKPLGDSQWHRADANETQIYDDSFAYALLGLYDYEGWSLTVQKTYNSMNTIKASAQYPVYNPTICWAGYIDVVSRSPACDYYDAVTAGILSRIRRDHDKPNLAFSMKIIGKHQSDFMFWGVKHADYSPVENRQAMATVCWLSILHLNYENPITRFTQILHSKGEDVTLYPIREAADKISYGEPTEFKAIVSQTRTDEVLIEAGYIINDYITLYTFTPLRIHDKVRRKGEDYEVQSVQAFDFAGETAHFKFTCRRLVGQ
jgi:hypothetical protein